MPKFRGQNGARTDDVGGLKQPRVTIKEMAYDEDKSFEGLQIT